MKIYGLYCNNNAGQDIQHKFNNSSTANSLTTDRLEIAHSSLTLQYNIPAVKNSGGNHSCMILGNFFSKNSIKRELDILAQGTISNLNKNYWGNYLFIDFSQFKLEIFVAQSSSIQFFYYHTPHYTIFATDVLFIAKFVKLSYNQQYLQHFLRYGDFISQYTPFENIMEVYGGSAMSIECSTNLSSKIYAKNIWRYDAISTNSVDNINLLDNSSYLPQTLVTLLEQIIQNHDHIFLDLSGGLDSSSILFALNSIKSHNFKIYGVNLADKFVKSSNEIEHVKKLQNKIEFELIQMDYNDCLPFTRMDNYSILPNKPTITMSHLKKYALQNSIAMFYSANPLFINGHGGDSLFLAPPLIECVSDLVLNGEMTTALEKIKELAVFYRKTFWEILGLNIKEIVRYWFNIKPKIGYPQQAPWYKNHDQHNTNYFALHDQTNFGVYPSELLRFMGLYFTMSSVQVNLINESSPIFFPFLAQPLLEAGLKVKPSQSFGHGYDRYIFRQAISRFFNTDLVWRKDKGHTTGVFNKGLIANKDYILSLCMDGYFAKSNILDKNILAEYYERISTGLPDHQWSFIHLLCLEMYIAQWNNHL